MEAKDRARAAVRRAVDAGTLLRPTHCSRCGRADPRRKDGRSAIHAHHHHGYERPLDVEWLCVRCHFQEDKRLFGNAHVHAKLTTETAAQILRRYRPGATCWRPEGGAKWLAREYGVSGRTIMRIVRGETWAAALDGEKPP